MMKGTRFLTRAADSPIPGGRNKMPPKGRRKTSILICMLVCLLAFSPLGQLQALTAKAAIPDPEGPEIEIYADQFDDPDNYGLEGGITIPQPWVQEGGKSLAKTPSPSSSAPSAPNMVKIDSTDVLALPLNLTGYGNIKISYYTRASSYKSGSVLVEWSNDGGATWTTLEDFKPPAGAGSDPNTKKTWALDAQANNNPDTKLRFRAEAPTGNLYFDSVSITGQAIPGIPPATSPVPIPVPVEQEPFVPPAGVIMYEDVLVGMAGNREIYASIAVPEVAPAEPMPAVVYIHGGGWNHGDRKQALGNISNYVLKRGYIGVALSYRLTPEAPFPAQIQDVKLGIRFLRAHAAQYFIDPSRIGVWGSSAGGHLASLLGTTGDMKTGEWITLDNGNTVQMPDLGGNGGWPEYSDKVQAVADWSGPADFTTEFANNYSSVTALLGGNKAFTVPNEARLAMPGTYASPDDPPFWIRHGDADATIPYQNSVKLADQLNAAGVPVVDFKLVPGQGHGFTGTASADANAEAWAFLDQYVKNRTVTEPVIYKPGYGPGGQEPGNPDSGNPGSDNGSGNPGSGSEPGSPAVQLDPQVWTMTAGASKEFTVAVTSSNPGTATVTWSTYNSGVASVESLGGTAARVTAVSPGSTRIVATVVSSVYQQPAVAESVVTVTPAEPKPPGQVVEKEIAVLTPTDDALIDSSLADTNINSATGSSQGLFSVSTGGTKKKYVYFKFDISGAANPLYHYSFQVAAKKGSTNTDVPLSLYSIEDSNWSEASLTWNNAPVKELAAANLLGSFTVDADKGSNPKVYTVDVTDYVRTRLAAGTAGFMLADAGNTGISLNIYTKEANGTSNPHPSLTVKELIDLSTDTAPPYWPEGSVLRAANLGTDFVDLQWPAALDDSTVSHYLVYRNNELLATLQPEELRYSAAGLTPATVYTFQVAAVDVAGKTSDVPLTLVRTTLAEPVLPLAVEAVTASSSDGNIESNTIDNNSYTRWSASGDSPWIMFDLGELRQVGYLGIGFYKGDQRKTLLDIETSTDGVSWTAGFSGWSSQLTTALQAFNLGEVSARYVRIIGHGNSDGSVFTSLADVHIYPPFANGDTPVALVPNILPGPPPGAVPFTKPGLTKADGSAHTLHTPNPVTGRTLNVLDFGADPADNGQDDRPAIQAAIDAAVAGDEVYIPNGVYNLTTSPDGLANLFLKSGVNIRGESESGTILMTSLNMVKNSTLFKSAKQHDLQISGMTLTSAWNKAYTTDHKANNPDAGGPDSLIMISNYGEAPSYNVTIQHVTVEKFRRMAIRIENSHDVIVRECTFRNATDLGPGGSGYGVAIQGMPKVDRLGFDNDTLWNLVEDSRFEGPYLRHATLIQNVAHNNTIRNNVFIQTKLDAIDLHGELEYLNEIYGNLVENILTGGAVGLGNTGGTAPTNHSKTGPGNLIRDNIIRNSREGVVVTMGTPDTVIQNNLIENTVAIPGASGINVLNGPGTVIRGNTIRNNTAEGYWAILLEHDNGDANAGYIGEGDPEDVVIESNVLTGNTNGIGLFAGKGIRLKGNTIDSIITNFYQEQGVEAVVEENPAPETPDSGDPSPNTPDPVASQPAGAVTLASVDGSGMERALGAASGGEVLLKPGSGSGRENGVQLDRDALGKLMQAGHVDTLVVETDQAAYALPVKELDLERIAREMGTDASGLALAITLRKNDSAAAEAAATGLNVAGAWEFTVKVSAPDGKEQVLDTFSRYVKRVVKPEGNGALNGFLAVARMIPAAGGGWTLDPVPFRMMNGEVHIYSRSNSTYLLVENKRSFADLNGHWARDSVERMAARMIADGTAPEEFQPDKALTRAELAAFLVRALGLAPSAGGRIEAFADVSGSDWFAGAVQAAVAARLVDGYGDGSFRPDQAVSRQELAVMTHRAAEFAGTGAAQAQPSSAPYGDEAEIAAWAKPAVDALTRQGLLNGMEDGSFAPGGEATRAESLMLLARLLERLEFSN